MVGDVYVIITNLNLLCDKASEPFGEARPSPAL